MSPALQIIIIAADDGEGSSVDRVFTVKLISADSVNIADSHHYFDVLLRQFSRGLRGQLVSKSGARIQGQQTNDDC